MKRRILVTGCNGYVASNLIAYLRKKHDVMCIGGNSKVNMQDYESVSNAVKNSDIILHIAAITNPFNKDIWKINVQYTKFLVNTSKKFNKRFIYISTQNVLFGKDNYSKTKREAEKLVKTLKNYVILRPTIIYGEGEKKYIGKVIKLVNNSFIIPIIGNGKNKLQPIYLKDLMNIIDSCLNKNIKGVFLVAGRSILSYDELVNLIIQKLNVVRLKIHVPIFFLRPFAFLFETFLKNPPITNIQLDNIKFNQDYDIIMMKKVFKINPKTIEQGIDLIIKNE